MVRGLEVFREWFKDFQDSYIIIGGAACEQQFEERGIGFRVTKDIDLVLIVEVLDAIFVEQFWEFIKTGKYRQTQVEEKERKYYRFADPENIEFPILLELFAKRPDIIQEIEGVHLTPIPTDEDLSSLSAILMNEDYYKLTLDNTQLIDGLPVASVEALIALKANAYINMTKQKSLGEKIDSRHISKHKNDILRLAAALTPESKLYCPDKVKTDISEYIKLMTQDKPDTKAIFKDMGIPDIGIVAILNQLETTFLKD